MDLYTSVSGMGTLVMMLAQRYHYNSTVLDGAVCMIFEATALTD